jgi:M6 family metalloprotease-like protein
MEKNTKRFFKTKRVILVVLVFLSAWFFLACNKIDQDELALFNDAYANVLSGKDFTNVTEGFTLATSYEEVTIAYSSSNPQVVSVSGGTFSVTQQGQDTVVVITVVLTHNGTKLTFYLNVIVTGTDIPGVVEDNDPDMAKLAWAEIIEALFSRVGANGLVTQDLIFLKKVTSSTYPRATWSTSHPSTISKEGVVLEPLNGNVNVHITANLKIAKAQLGTTADYNVNKEFYFTVPKYNIPWGDVVNYTDTASNTATLLSQDIVSHAQVEQFPTNPENGTVSVNIVVIPIEFTNDEFTSAELEKIQKAFFGTSLETGWESLSSFYNKSSYGKVNINGAVTTPYNTGRTIAQFENDNKYQGNCYVDYAALTGALAAKVDELTLSQNDGNGDGYIDGVYLVYSAPQQSTSNPQPHWNGTYPPYWTYHNVYDPEKFTQGDFKVTQAGSDYRPYGYVWYSYENINESISELDININAEILVHESGRFFGLPYFYDYAYGPEVVNGLGYMDMMYANIGDHGPWNKMVLGWIRPMVVTNSGTTIIKLNDAPTTGQLIMVKPTWDNSYYGEYLLIDYYAPTGLYELQTTHTTGYPVFTTRGVRIYHVTYNLDKNFNPGVNKYVAGKLIEYLTGDGTPIPATGSIDDKALFLPGCSYDWSKFAWSTNVALDKDEVLVRVLEIDAEQEYAVISITLK